MAWREIYNQKNLPGFQQPESEIHVQGVTDYFSTNLCFNLSSPKPFATGTLVLIIKYILNV